MQHGFGRHHAYCGLLARLVVGELLPVVWSTWTLLRVVLAMFVPLMGRAGPGIPADAIVGVLVGLLVSLITLTGASFAAGLPALPRGFRRIGVSLVGASVLLAATTFPYSAEPPRLKRIFLQHTLRTVHGLHGAVHSDSGVWINTMDALDLRPFRAFPGFER